MSKTDNQKNIVGRYAARELIMKMLFQMEAQNDYSNEIKTAVFAENSKDKTQELYLEQMYLLISEHLPKVDELIESCSDKWKIDRMNKVDLATMRVAVLEIMYLDDIPESVSINEAVDIAKKYGTENSGKFVNGVLGKVVKVKDAN